MQKYNSVIIGVAVFFILTLLYFKMKESDKEAQERKNIIEMQKQQVQDSLNIITEKRKPYEEIQEKINYLLELRWTLSNDGFIEQNSSTESYRINVRDMDFIYRYGSLVIMCSDSSNCFKYTKIHRVDYQETYSSSTIEYACGQATFNEVKKQIGKYKRIMVNP